VARTSAGLLPYRRREGALEVLIAHMGGPFWARKDEGAWSILKGEYDPGREEPLAAARREFAEEAGVPAPLGEPLALGELRTSGKLIAAWAVEADGLDPEGFSSNTFTLEWPRGSGAQQEFPEIDRAAWLDLATARAKLVKGQVPFLDTLERALG
jgi:predicted NUDIX family NTP pyrophosphohydrolase